MVLRGFVSSVVDEAALLEELAQVTEAAPFRHLVTPGGFRMSVAMTNCGALGWISDLDGYRYEAVDPDSGRAWPALPPTFRRLATEAATRGGFPDFVPDACLVNQYQPGARLTLHQDRNERDDAAPIVSVSLGLPAIFLFGGSTRRERPARIPVHHGDVVVWGGPSRMRYHGIAPLSDGLHARLGARRINFTFRTAA